MFKSISSTVHQLNHPIKADPNQLQFNISNRVVPTIEAIATGTPSHPLKQSDAAKFVANLPSIQQNQSRIGLHIATGKFWSLRKK